MSFELKDRVPTKPNRKLITPENGSSPYYATVINADEPVEAGTPINKATLEKIGIIEYKYSKLGNSHILTGSGENVKFIPASDFVSGDTIEVNGKIVLAVDNLGEAVDEPFKANIVQKATLQGDKLVFRVGGGTYGTLPPQIKNFTAKAGNHQITLTWQNPSDSNHAGTYLVRKQGSMPTKLSDGTKIDVGKATSYTDREPENDKLYYYRAFPYNAKKQVQTELTGAVVSATPVLTNIQKYLAEIPDMSISSFSRGFASTGNYALIAGNFGETGNRNIVDIYDDKLIHSVTALSSEKYGCCGISFNVNALIAGGNIRASKYETDEVEIFNSTLTKSYSRMSMNRYEGIGVANDKYALVAGGSYSDSRYHYYTDVVDAFDEQFVLTTVSPLAIKRCGDRTTGVSFKKYAIVAGGTDNQNFQNYVEAYNLNLVKSMATPLVEAGKLRSGGAVAGDFALIAGGVVQQNGKSVFTDNVELYNLDLVKLSNIRLSEAKQGITGVSIGHFAVFAGGDSTKVEIFDNNLVRKIIDIETKRGTPYMPINNNFVLVAGGYDGTQHLKKVEALKYIH